jgi:DNA-directed RNA polymerase subunit RPC12/RpoP
MVSSTPEFIEPTREYLGVACANCQRFVAVVGPLDPIQIPRDKPMRVGARGPLTVECPHCKHRAEYPVGELRRGTAEQS